MATIRIKRGTTDPTAAQVTLTGELAANYSTPKLFIKTADDSSTTPVWIGAQIENSPTWASASATKLATQSAIKTYVDSVAGGPATALTLSNATANASYGVLLTSANTNGTATVFIDASDSLFFNPSTNLLTCGGGITSTGDLTVGANGNLITSKGSIDVFNTSATTVNAFGAVTTFNLGNTATAAQTVNMFTASTGGSTYNFATGATTNGQTRTINIGTTGANGSTTEINLGTISGTTGTQNINIGSGGAAGGTTTVTVGNSSGTSTINLNASDITSSKGTVQIFDTNSTTVNTFGSATTLNFGYDGTAASSTTNINTGATTTGQTKTINIGTAGAGGSTTAINIGSTTGTSTTTINQDLVVGGNLTVNGTTTNINTTNLVVEDKNIILGDVTTPSDTTADGGGITLKGASDKTFNWVNATSAWTSSEDLNLLTGKVYEINGTTVLSATTLGSGVTTSSLTTVGALSSGSIASGFTTINVANLINILSLDIDGAAATTAIVGADLLIVDDGANGTNRKVTIDNLFGSNSTATIDGGTY